MLTVQWLNNIIVILFHRVSESGQRSASHTFSACNSAKQNKTKHTNRDETQQKIYKSIHMMSV